MWMTTHPSLLCVLVLWSKVEYSIRNRLNMAFKLQALTYTCHVGILSIRFCEGDSDPRPPEMGQLHAGVLLSWLLPGLWTMRCSIKGDISMQFPGFQTDLNNLWILWSNIHHFRVDLTEVLAWRKLQLTCCTLPDPLKYRNFSACDKINYQHMKIY